MDWWKQLKRDAEEWMDRKWGKPTRKKVEQGLHALMGSIAGIPLPGIIFGIELATGFEAHFAGYVVAGLIGSVAWATYREYKQNIGDPSDETTIRRIGNLPINKDMIIDWLFTGGAGILPGVIFYLI